MDTSSSSPNRPAPPLNRREIVSGGSSGKLVSPGRFYRGGGGGRKGALLFQLTRSTTLETGGNWPPFPSTIYTIFLFFYRYLFEEERGRNAVFNIAIDSMERTRVKKKKSEGTNEKGFEAIKDRER